MKHRTRRYRIRDPLDPVTQAHALASLVDERVRPEHRERRLFAAVLAQAVLDAAEHPEWVKKAAVPTGKRFSDLWNAEQARVRADALDWIRSEAALAVADYAGLRRDWWESVVDRWLRYWGDRAAEVPEVQAAGYGRRPMTRDDRAEGRSIGRRGAACPA